MPYVAEAIPSRDIKDTLDTQWNTQSDNIPKPTLVDINDGVSAHTQISLTRGGLVAIRTVTPVIEEEPIGNWSFVNRRTQVELTIYTPTSRQRLYDLQQEIRRIIHARLHLLTNYQRVQFKAFNELTDESANIWIGIVILELVNNAVAFET